MPTLAERLADEVKAWRVRNKALSATDVESRIQRLHFEDVRAIDTTELSLLKGFPNLRALSLTFCGIQNLSQLPLITPLESLDLSDNVIKDSVFADFAKMHFPNLRHLNLTNNQLSDLSAFIAAAKSAPWAASLKHLELGDGDCPFKTPADLVDDWRSHVYAALPALETLDRRDKQGEEADVSEMDDDDSDNDDEEDDDDLDSFLDDGEDDGAKDADGDDGDDGSGDEDGGSDDGADAEGAVKRARDGEAVAPSPAAKRTPEE